MQCPKCKLENVPTAEYCDCGYSFKTGEVIEAMSKYDKLDERTAEQLRSGYFGSNRDTLNRLVTAHRVLRGNYDEQTKRRARRLIIVGCLVIGLGMLIAIIIRGILG